MIPSDLVMTSFQGLVLGLLTLPVCLWAVVSDIKEMKIRNNAVLALLVIYVVAGFFLFPLDQYLWGFAGFAIVLVIGFGLNMIAGVGAGDAKFAAAMAPFIFLADFGTVAMLYVFWSVALLIGMTIVRRNAGLRAKYPDWIWFKEDLRRHVPFGIGLAPTLTAYLAIAAAIG